MKTLLILLIAILLTLSLKAQDNSPLDSLMHLISIAKTDSLVVIDSLNNKLNESNERLSKASRDLNQKTQQIRQKGDVDILLPDGSSLGSTSAPNTTINTPNPLNTINQSTSQITTAPQEALQEIDILKDSKELLGEVESIGNEVDGYPQELKELKETNWKESIEKNSERMEQQLTQSSGLEELGSSTEAIDQIKSTSETYKTQVKQYQNRSFMKQQLSEKFLKMSSERIAQNTEALQTAHKEMSKYKKKYTQVQSIKELPKRMPNVMKGKSFWERKIFGLYVQTQTNEYTSIDLLPAFGYKLSGIFTAGVSGTYRLNFQPTEDLPSYYPDHQMYGYHLFIQTKLSRGFHFHTEFERMNAEVHSFSLFTTQETKREWVNGLLVGLIKRYNVSRVFKGNVQALINLNHKQSTSPYNKKFMLRFGIEINGKKKLLKQRT